MTDRAPRNRVGGVSSPGGSQPRWRTRAVAVLAALVVTLAVTAPLAASAAIAPASSPVTAPPSAAIAEAKAHAAAPAVAPAVAQLGAAAAVDKRRQNTTLVLLDTSGSMNDAVGVKPGSVSSGTGGVAAKETKLDAARSAIVKLVYSLPSSTNYGLVAYPFDLLTGNIPSLRAPSLGGCPAVSLVTPLGKLNPVTAMTDVRRLHASGGTPTAPSLQYAAKLLSGRGQGGGTIVLVTDGMANCGGDPCDVAKDLHKSNIDLQVNVVGFDVDASTDTSLTCIATETGGQYISIDDPDKLSDAIAGASQPRLELTVQAPTTTLEPTYVGDGQTVTATVTNTGTRPATNVRATFSVTGNGRSSTVAPPVRYLGNLAPGATHTVSFTVRLAAEAGTTQSWRATTISDFATDAAQTGTFTVADRVSPASLTGPLAGVKRVIVVGDSYSSGEGASVDGASLATGKDAYDDKTYGEAADASQCHRSKYAYGRAIWGSDATMIACSGAVTKDFYTSQKSGKKGPPAQLTALREKATDPATTPDAVLLTLGGNDVAFGETVIRCTLTPTCYVDRGMGVDWSKMDAVESSLAQVYEDVDSAVNDATALEARGGRAIPIVVLPYVRGIPNGDAGKELPNDCQTFFSGDDLAFLNTFIGRLNDSIVAAVRQRQKAGRPVYLAGGVENAFLPGHTICDKSSSYLTYYAGGLITLPGGELRQELLHPNIAGHAAEAFALAAWSSQSRIIPATRAEPYAPAKTDPGLATRILSTLGAFGREAGGAIVRASSGWAPFAPVTWVLRSDPRLLGTTYADASGTVHLDGLLPVDVPPGEHHITASGWAADGSPRKEVESLTVRRRGFVLACAAIGVGLLLPVIVFARVRRRPRRARRA